MALQKISSATQPGDHQHLNQESKKVSQKPYEKIPNGRAEVNWKLQSTAFVFVIFLILSSYNRLVQCEDKHVKHRQDKFMGDLTPLSEL